MDKSRFLFVGVGQCGNNIINELDAYGYNTFAINTSELDLKDIDVKHKFIIPKASGCARDRRKALNYLKQNYNRILTSISERFKEQDIIYFVFSLGGGTGSGISPLLIDALSRKYYDKHFCSVVVAPSINESIQCKINAIESYNELIRIPNLKSVFIIDNNSLDDKLKINTEFVRLFEEVVNVNKPNKRGVIDEYELEKLLTYKGNSVILNFEGSADGMRYANSIFLEYEKGCKYIGVSTVEDIEMSLIENEFGVPIDVFKGYSDSSNILIACGMKYPMYYFKQLDKEVDNFRGNNVEGSLVSDVIDTKKYKDIHKEIDFNMAKDIDFDELFKNYI